MHSGDSKFSSNRLKDGEGSRLSAGEQLGKTAFEARGDHVCGFRADGVGFFVVSAPGGIAGSLGQTHLQAMRYVILPQAVKRMIPPLGNEFIVLLKDSSLLAVITVPELMYWGRAFQGQYYKIWEPYLTAALIYLILTLSMSFILDRIEKRLATE